MEHNNDNFFAGSGFARRINSVVDGVRYVIEAWQEFDLGNIMQYAQSSRNEQEYTYKLQLIEGLKEDFENSIGKLFKE